MGYRTGNGTPDGLLPAATGYRPIAAGEKLPEPRRPRGVARASAALSGSFGRWAPCKKSFKVACASSGVVVT